MGSLTHIIGIVAGILAFGSYLFYIASILRGQTKPNRASWWVWAGMGIVVWLSYYYSGARESLWVPLSEVIGPIIAAILSIKYGEGGWTPFDRKCLFGIVIVLLLWWIFNSPVIALAAGLSIDLFAALPTIKKSYLKPFEENLTAWILVVVANFLNLFAISTWTFGVVLHPVYYTLITGSILASLILGYQKRKISWFKKT